LSALRGAHTAQLVLSEPLVCTCGWSVLSADYARSMLGKRLHGGSTMHIWEHYVQHLSGCADYTQKMRLVDWLLHQLHASTRSVSVQLIGGSPRQVAALLDALAATPASTPGLAEQSADWREQMRAGAYASQLPGDPLLD